MKRKLVSNLSVAAMLLGMIVLMAACNSVGNTHEYKQPISFMPVPMNSDFPNIKYDNGGFYDDFLNGIDPSMWMIAKMQWGGTGANGGVIPENVSYTKDGVLALTGNGDFYEGPIRGIDANGLKKSNGKRTGAALVSKETFGPGSYEIRMKVHPRLGACSAMWTYFNDGVRNHEIDIEIPGNMHTFNQTLFSNWLTDNDGISRAITPQTPNNDGQWHTYRFDWHTDQARMDYYVDGVKVLSVDDKVPNVKGRLWLGVWFPKDWCGNPSFDTGHMLVDWVKFTPFSEGGTEAVSIPEPRSSNDEEYPKQTSPLPQTNYISNADFEVDSTAWVISENVQLVDDPNRSGSRITEIKGDGTLIQNVHSINKGMAYTLSAYGYVSDKGDSAVATITFLDTLNLPIKDADQTIIFQNTAFRKQMLNFTTPANATRIRITLSKTGGSGAAYFDDLSLIVQGTDTGG